MTCFIIGTLTYRQVWRCSFPVCRDPKLAENVGTFCQTPVQLCKAESKHIHAMTALHVTSSFIDLRLNVVLIKREGFYRFFKKCWEKRDRDINT
jgi:hypothetical protein